MDKLSHYLTTSGLTRPLDGERVTFLAKRASNDYLENGVDLSKAVSSIVQGEGLNREQIKRVCEEANTQTFRQLFEKQANKNISFPLADPSVVFSEAPAQTSRPAPTSIHQEYYTPGSDGVDALAELFSTGEEKTANIAKVRKFQTQGMSLPDAVKAAYPDYSDEQVKEYVRQYGGGVSKTASAEGYGYEVPEAEMIRTWERIKGIEDYAQSKLDSLEILEKQAQADLEHHIIQAVRGGNSFQDVLASVSPLVRDGDLFVKVSSDIARSMVEKGEMDTSSLQLTKISARRCPNPDHPIVVTYGALERFHKEASLLRETVDISSGQRRRVEKALGIGRIR